MVRRFEFKVSGPILGLCEICIVDLGFRDSQSHTLRYMKNTFLLTFFHHFLIVLHLRSPPSGRARIIIISLFFLHFSFVSRSLGPGG